MPHYSSSLPHALQPLLLQEFPPLSSHSSFAQISNLSMQPFLFPTKSICRNSFLSCSLPLFIRVYCPLPRPLRHVTFFFSMLCLILLHNPFFFFFTFRTVSYLFYNLYRFILFFIRSHLHRSFIHSVHLFLSEMFYHFLNTFPFYSTYFPSSVAFPSIFCPLLCKHSPPLAHFHPPIHLFFSSLFFFLLIFSDRLSVLRITTIVSLFFLSFYLCICLVELLLMLPVSYILPRKLFSDRFYTRYSIFFYTCTPLKIHNVSPLFI